MGADEGVPLRRPTRSQPRLPNIRDLRMRRARPVPPKLQNFNSRVSADREAIEFIVELDRPVPTRAYGPALYVGDVQVHNSERLDDTTWRLVSFEPDLLEPGAPVSWGWMNDPPRARHRTKFRFEIDDDEATTSTDEMARST